MSFPGAASARDRLPIASRGVIGDGLTCALVRADGIIDWLCLPRFDSPSVFGGVLDVERGGATGVLPIAPFTSLQRYDPDTNVLETLFEVPGQGTVRIIDSMPWSDDPRAVVHEVHRRVECMEGEVELELFFDPRFDYGRSTPRIERHEHGVLARSGNQSLALAVGGAPQWVERPGGGLGTRMRIASGEMRWVVLSWDALRPERLAAYRAYEHLRVTRASWRRWSARIRYDGPWRHHVLRSAMLLKMLIYAPTGAMVAAPTASLPEWIGGGRNWDYRYTWARDAAMAIRATNLLGCRREAVDFFHFLRDALAGTGDLHVMYSIDGRPVPAEEELEHLSGYGGSKPVRIGNGAREQLQLDSAGAVVDAAHLFERFGGLLPLQAWRGLRQVIGVTGARWTEPDDGMWEPRAGKRHNVHSKLMSWVALDRGAQIAARFDGEDRQNWISEAEKVRRAILERGLDPTGRHFVSAFGGTEADASLLLIPIHGLLPPDDPRVVATIDRVRAELSDGSFVHRYRYADGVGGDEGAFVLCGFWLAEALAMAGRIEEAQEVFVAHAEKASNHLGLLGEEVDPRTNDALGNFPQAFSHLGLINAAARIDLALRMRDEGAEHVPHLIPSSDLAFPLD